MSRERAVIVEWNVLEKCDWLYNNFPGDVRLRASCPEKAGSAFFVTVYARCQREKAIELMVERFTDDLEHLKT